MEDICRKRNKGRGKRLGRDQAEEPWRWKAFVAALRPLPIQGIKELSEIK